MNIFTKLMTRITLLILLALNSFNVFSQESCYDIENITNGRFTGGSTAGWTLGTGWAYGNQAIGVANTTRPATNLILSQTLANPLTTQTYKLTFWAGVHDYNSSDRTRTATLEVKIGGVTYAKFTNNTGNSNNVTLEYFNGATSDFTSYSTATGWVGSKIVNFEIPINAASASNNDIEFIYNSAGDYFAVRDVSLLSCSSPLPIKLIDFGVKQIENDVVLNWETASETGNSHFDIEISSDAINFSYLGTISGSGTTESGQKYTYVHKNPSAGVTYYRLKQVDEDGTYEYFTIKSVDIKEDVFIYPNPATTHLILSNLALDTKYEVLDGQGRIVLNSQANRQHSAVLDIATLPRGMYFIRLSRAGMVTVKKFYAK